MKRAGSILVVLTVVGVAASVAVQLNATSHTTPVVWPAGEIKWSDSTVIKGAKVAVLWGDPAKGAHGAMRSVPAGAVLALHTHTNNHRVVMMSGTIDFSIDGMTKELGPGSYAYIPGGVQHSAQCRAGAECRYLEVYEGMGDIKFVEEKK